MARKSYPSGPTDAQRRLILAPRVTPADVQDRAEVGTLAGAAREATGGSVEVAFVDQGLTGEAAAASAAAHGIRLEVVKLPVAERGFVLLPRRWVVERSYAWAARFRRLAATLAGLHFVAFVRLMLRRLAPMPSSGS